jgi:hypothetical protein
MKDTLTQVSSKQLVELQSQLNELAKELNETYEFVRFSLTKVGEQWKDDKFEEFNTEFNSTKEEILEISERFKEYANQYLPPFIEVTQKVENLKTSI